MANTPHQDQSAGMRKDQTRGQQKNQGEGNRDAAKAYNQDQQKFVKSGQVDKAAQDAKKAVDGPEGDALRRAEKAGKDRAAERDPAERPDFRKPS